MNDNSQNRAYWLMQIEALANEAASDGQVAELEQLLINHPEARKAYAEWAQLQVDLGMVVSAGEALGAAADTLCMLPGENSPTLASLGPGMTPIDRASNSSLGVPADLGSESGQHSLGNRLSTGMPAPFVGGGSVDDCPLLGSNSPGGHVGPSSLWSAMRWPAFTLLLALVAIVGAAGAEIWLMLRGSQVRTASAPIATITPAAYLTSDTGCAWGGTSTRFRTVGSSVDFGEEISLLEGIAEFRLSSGVFLSIEGPAGVVLASPNSLVLQYGKLTAHVPWSTDDFKVLAGACRIEASNAEFGVFVTGGRVDAHVFSGEALAVNASLFDETLEGGSGTALGTSEIDGIFTRAIVTQNRAISLSDRNGMLKTVKTSKANPALFATKLSMAGRLPVSKKYVDAVLASRPAAYWRFESDKGGVVDCEVNPGQTLQIVGDVRLSGNAGNQVAEFRPGAECYLIGREPMRFLFGTDYSIEVWVKPSHTHCSGILSLYTLEPATSAELCAFLLELESSSRQPVRSAYSAEHPNSIRFLHRNPPGRSSKTGTSCFSQLPYDARRWQHVVAVKRGAEMQLYVDGKLAATARDETSLASDVRVIVGRPEIAGSSFQFIGQLDEVAMYPRALREGEILTHFRALDWTDERKPPRVNSGLARVDELY